MFRDVLLEGLAAHTLYDVPSESYPIVRIGRHFAGGKILRGWFASQEVSEWRRLLWVGKKNVRESLPQTRRCGSSGSAS